MRRALGGRYRPILRPAVAFVVFVLVVSALFQGLGRLGMWLLDDLEGTANAWLGGQARLDGLRGGWDGLNPVASARRIELSAGWVESVTVELDLLESVRRNRPVLGRLFVESAELAVERAGAGWRLAGMEAAASGLDLLELLGDIDEVRFNGRLTVAGAGEESLAVEVRGVNRDGAHAVDLSLANPQCPVPCRLEARWRAEDPTWMGRPAERFLRLSGGFLLPGPFVDGLGLTAGLRLHADGRWLERGDRGGGAFALQLAQAGLPGGAVGFLETELRGGFHDGRRSGRLVDSVLRAANAGLRLDPIHFRTRPGGAELWTGRLQLGELARFLTVALGGVRPVRDWLGALQPEGELLNVRVALGRDGIGYAATFAGLGVEAYRGVPWVREAEGEIVGYDQGALLTLNSEALRVGIADVFEDRWRWENTQGNLHIWFSDDYLGLRVPHVRLEAAGTRLSGSFSLARPEQRAEHRVAMLVDGDSLRVEQGRTYIPYHLSEGTRRWLREGPRGGRIVGLRLAYQGQVQSAPDDRSRRLEMRGRVHAGEVRYHPDWPLVSEVEGFVELAGSETFATVDSARTLAAGIRDTRVRLGDNGAFAEVALAGEVDVGGGLDFVRGSPLAEWMAFVAPDWDGGGRLELEGELFIPMDEADERPVDCRLGLELSDARLVLPDYRLEVERLDGPVAYACPHHLSAAALTAELFGHPAGIAADSDDDSIDLRFSGTASEADVYRLIDVNDPGLAAGQALFDATLTLAVDDSASTMTVTSDLAGLRIDLPGEFAKDAGERKPARLDLEFLDEHIGVRLRHGDMQGWFHVADVPLRGAIGVRGPEPPVGPDADEVVVAGRIGDADLEEWMVGAGAMDIPVPWRLEDVHVDRLRVATQVFENLRLTGGSRGDSMRLEFASTGLTGQLRSTGDEPLDLDFQSIRLPEADGEGDPLDVSIIDGLPDADVSIESLVIGGEDFGTWSFALRRRPAGVVAGDLHARLKGTEISAPAGVFWNAATDRSSGAVRLTMQDLAEVLPQWDYAPSVEAESAELLVDASWPGSPLNVEVNGLRGDVSFRASDGSFVEVAGGGALRIMSLLNINTVFKRMSLDFKDVTARGTSFDTIRADTRFHDGLMTFVEPAKVKGSGSDFKLGGSVNLVDGIMNDNEMIVTLPVSDSLPWYAVYISLANPVAAAAVIAGQQVLKKQIKQMSSAKYQISGSWDDPQVKLVGIWNDSVQDFDELAQEEDAPGLPDETRTEGGR